MKVLFLYPYPIGESPSQRFRFEQYYSILRKEGFEITGQAFWNLRTWRALYKPGQAMQKVSGLIKGFLRRIYILWKASNVDFVFIHRECTPIGPPIVEWIISKVMRKKVIYDFDDAIWLPNTSSENRLISFIKWSTKFKSICRWSSRISCGNAYLGAVAGSINTNIVINPTTIDTLQRHNPELFHSAKNNTTISLGWTGTHSTMKYLDFIVPVIQKLEEKFLNLNFIVISNKKPAFNLKSLTFIPWSKESEIEDLLLIDVGIMPLLYDEWSEGKCGFKILQYMALNIPSVSTPIGVNKTIIDHGINGYLCETQEEWIACLEKLIQQPKTRLEIGKAGRKKVVDNYSVSSNSSTFLSLFK